MENRKNEEQSTTYLASHFQNCTQGYIELRFINKTAPKKVIQEWIPLSKIESISSILRIHRTEYHCYFGVSTRRENGGKKEDVIEIPCLWVDLDDYKLTPEQKEESKQRYEAFPLKASFIIHSGRGKYFVWLLKEPATKEDIPQGESLLDRLVSYFHGDPAPTDASRILRIPGGLNHKLQPPTSVKVREFSPNLQYNLDDFDSLLPQAERRISEREEPVDRREEIRRVMECAFLQHCDKDRAILSEPEWYAMVSILCRFPGHRSVIHSLSRGYPKYNAKETDEKILHAGDGSGPITCETIKKLWDCGKDCGMKSPAALVLRTQSGGTKDDKKGLDVHYQLTTLRDVFEYPDPSFIIDPILVDGTVSILGAYTGTGKSLLALSIIKSILTGTPLWGKYPVNKTGSVLLVDEETPKPFLKERTQKMKFDETLPLYFLHFQDVRLDKDECYNALMAKIEEVKPVLVVIDSLIRVHRQKEDDSTTMSRVVDRLRKIANAGTTVLVIHHHKKGEGPLSQMLRGSSDIPGGIDIEYALISKDGYLQFSSVKTRTKPLDPIRLKMEVTETSIEMVYGGTEAEEVLKEVTDILKGGKRLGVSEIFEELQKREHKVGINTLRTTLKDALGKEIQGQQQDARGKPWLFWIEKSNHSPGSNVSSLFTGLYKEVKSEETNQDSPDSSHASKKEESPCEETIQCFRKDNDSSRVQKQGVREELKNNFEVPEDGQFTY